MPEEKTTLSMSYGKTLLFVYNADSGVFPGMKDYSLKSGTSNTRQFCNLTAITNSPIGMKKDWKRFVRELDIPARFLNRNEFVSEIGAGLITFPAILVQTGKDLLMLASSEEINRCQSLEDLINLVKARSREIP
ncbi:MAG: hypothetical protein LUQ71_07215 [Methanoregula sp.]|nr:hypothetical protein [Methanoregula sp.]